MVERYIYMDERVGHALLSRVKGMAYSKRGIDRRAFIIDDYAVLSTSRLKLRNADVRDDQLVFFDEIIESLAKLRERGVSVVPILGYCYDPASPDGAGYIFQQRAQGEELYDDAVLAQYQVWAQRMQGDIYLTTDKSKTDAAAYIAERTEYIAEVPQEHFDKFICDIIAIWQEDILIDFMGSSNFFYDSNVGFQFIDLDAHYDCKYGLAQTKPDMEEIVTLGGFAPCHFAVGTKAFASSALDEEAIAGIGEEKLSTLKEANCVIYEKCRMAIEHAGIDRKRMMQTLRTLKIFGR